MRQVHVADGIQFVRDITNSVAADEVHALYGNVNTSDNTIHSIKGICGASSTEVGDSSRIDVLIIDVDSSNSRWMQILNFSSFSSIIVDNLLELEGHCFNFVFV